MEDDRPLRERARQFFATLQDEICAAIEQLDGDAGFHEDLWDREGGGGGRTRVMANGGVFEKAGINFSEVHGQLPEAFAARLPMGEGTDFFATGVSLVLHPQSPMVPTVHANFRFLERGSAGWFGGGTDMTPYYPYREDVVHFHRTLKDACDRFDCSFYPRFKKWCDDYFFIKHRSEARGVGGIFFDYLTGDNAPNIDRPPHTGIEAVFELVKAIGRAFAPAYLPVARRRCTEAYGERERDFQLIRRGRYVEFNLVYDRGTTFGLETRGRTESILMSLPPVVKWVYDYHPEPGSREAEAWDFFRAQDWLGIECDSPPPG
ncbi:MAG TPA: oxygen-dependent coproporphyrinogen oxidase [Blastocatellia bacterium]|nr:oxygen-dependent coproporphyrinogen oxidase [Blastocatellia bacterium]